MNEKIDEIKFGGQDNNTEQVAGALLKLPRFPAALSPSAACA